MSAKCVGRGGEMKCTSTGGVQPRGGCLQSALLCLRRQPARPHRLGGVCGCRAGAAHASILQAAGIDASQMSWFAGSAVNECNNTGALASSDDDVGAENTSQREREESPKRPELLPRGAVKVLGAWEAPGGDAGDDAWEACPENG